ncbi:hypothetical protein J6590_090243 [Homalodisca vitripennis]|nr:hypothetical protein J6590_090243 [Homalodisca vitripennis]
MIKKVWRGEPEGVRPLGRPRMRWRDQVEKDLRTIGATLEVAQDRVGETLLARSKTIWVSSGHRSTKSRGAVRSVNSCSSTACIHSWHNVYTLSNVITNLTSECRKNICCY